MNFDQNKAFSYLEKLTSNFKDRLGGSANEKKAAAYIRRHFTACGLKSWFQYFPVKTYRIRQQKLVITQPGLGEIPCEPVGLAANTPKHGLTGEIVFVDTAEEEYLSPALKGKILLLYAGIPYKRYEAVMKVKPAALIEIEYEVRKPPIRIELMPEWRDKWGAVPIVRITHEDGYRILRKKARQARIIVDFVEEEARSLNVISELAGKEKPEEIVVIGGHMDTSPGIKGASDNAGGTALVMELARIFAKKGSKRTLRFVAWGSEELGLRGSIFYAKGLKDADKKLKKKKGFAKTGRRTDLDRYRLCINLDVHGVLVGYNQAMISGPADLGASVRLMAKEMGPAFSVRDEVYSSDGTPFSEAGVPSVSFARSGGTSTYLHTPMDDIGYLDAGMLGMHGRFIEEWLERYVTQAVSFPFERTVPDEMKKKIKEYFNERLGLPLE